MKIDVEDVPSATAVDFGRDLSVSIRWVVAKGRLAAIEADVWAFSPVSVTFPGHLGVPIIPPPAGCRE